jgi:hypothetical protein
MIDRVGRVDVGNSVSVGMPELADLVCEYSLVT